MVNARQIAAPKSVTAAHRAPILTVVTVTYNSSSEIVSFLAALPAALTDVSTARVLVVDNSSTDDTVTVVRNRAPWADIVELGDNRGYAAGINRGIEYAKPAGAVLVLNPDVQLAPRSIRLLLDAQRNDETVGLSVPRIENVAGELSYSLRREPTISRALGEAILGGRRAARFPMLTEVVADDGLYRRDCYADWATGAAMLISRRALDLVGPWSEDYFLYSEETDYALRVRDAGMRLKFVSRAVAVHHGGGLHRSPFLWSLQAVNRTRLYRRRHRRIPSVAYWGAIALNEAIRAATGSPTHRAALRALFSRGYVAKAVATTAALRPAERDDQEIGSSVSSQMT